ITNTVNDVSFEQVYDLLGSIWQEITMEAGREFDHDTQHQEPMDDVNVNLSASSSDHNDKLVSVEWGSTQLHAAPPLPVFITSRHKKCPECGDNLKVQAGKNVEVITLNGIKNGVYFLKSCRKRQTKNCTLVHIDADKIVYNESGLKKLIYHAKKEIERIGFFRLNQNWYISWEAAELWCVDLASILA
ncbi:hypothetical protein HDU76_005622, partial [Blyttiomyces sp. JEL0837]